MWETQHAGKKQQHMYQWGLERRSDNIDVLRNAPEWGRSAPEVWETQDGGNITCISGVWSVGATILMCSGALRSSSGVGSERSGAPELLSSGVAPERSEVGPESLVSVTSDQSIYDFYF